MDVHVFYVQTHRLVNLAADQLETTSDATLAALDWPSSDSGHRVLDAASAAWHIFFWRRLSRGTSNGEPRWKQNIKTPVSWIFSVKRYEQLENKRCNMLENNVAQWSIYMHLPIRDGTKEMSKLELTNVAKDWKIYTLRFAIEISVNQYKLETPFNLRTMFFKLNGQSCQLSL